MTFVDKLTNVALHGGDVTIANVLTIVGLAKVITLYRYSSLQVNIVHAQHQECTVITIIGLHDLWSFALRFVNPRRHEGEGHFDPPPPQFFGDKKRAVLSIGKSFRTSIL